ncbi:GAF domain-containing protein [Aerosakkonema funiforme]|uniref:GAF domain-containing protein n=1 Tax=Aerosakkonema funiforme FACHB-1375 TaxID=2949571 RepID=A0A926VFF9_9CYAN|nr:GAF domain-containing protein [Aerosakkonema funiforme]MBD2182951.1 GAF domain-containing protein [Aerosakkonema funiforme FACHB-1375]
MDRTSTKTSTSNSTINSEEQGNLISLSSSSEILPVAPNAETSAVALQDPSDSLPVTSNSISPNKLIDTLALEIETGWWKKLSLKNKATIGAIAIATMPTLIIGITSYYSADKLAGVVIGTGFSVAIGSAIAIFLVNRAIFPILLAAAAVKQLGQGKLDTRINFEAKDELGILGSNINQLADRLQTLLAEKEAAARRDRLLGDIAWRARQATDTQELTNRILAGIRRILNVDRALIYRFNSDWSGTIVAESVGAGWTKALDEKIDDPCFRARYIPQYQNGRVRAIDDIYNEPGLTDCHIRTLEQFEVKANLVAPMRKDNRLVGLLIAHQCSGTRNWKESEIDFFLQLASQIEYALDHVGFIEQLQAAARRERLLGDLAWKARQATEPSELLSLSLNNIRKVLQVDRALIYQFNPDWSGTIVAESVATGWTKALDEQIDDPCFRARYVPQYQNGRVRAIDNIYNEPGLTDCHIRTLEQFEVKANLVAPMRKDDRLVGLLIVHQCSSPRNWQQSEIDFLLQVAIQIEYALDHVGFIKELEKSRQEAEAKSAEQRQQKEALQAQLEKFLQQIEGAFQGDLTVRAGVTAGELGTVADFFNALIENLQHIVMQVQSSADAVTQTAKVSEVDVNTLSDEARRQSESIAAILEQIQIMANSIQKVASSAQQAALKVQEANQTLKVGDKAMNKTVDGILTIQKTVEETALKVKRLGESSQKISRVSSLIKDLANQTNILALNASIEATGSGKQSQGFAIVAEEVRTLAEQSAGAAKEIEQIVEEIQIETNEVVAAMEAGIAQVSTGTNLVKTTRAKLTSIAAVSAQIRTLVEDMASSATSQMQTSSNLSQSIQEVATIANQTSEQSQAVADSFTKLLGVADELQESVAQFRVK